MMVIFEVRLNSAMTMLKLHLNRVSEESITVKGKLSLTLSPLGRPYSKQNRLEF